MLHTLDACLNIIFCAYAARVARMHAPVDLAGSGVHMLDLMTLLALTVMGYFRSRVSN